MRASVWPGVIVVFVGIGAVSGCGRPPGAFRMTGDRGDSALPRGRVHFVEHGRRAEGVLVTVTRGGETPFRVHWKSQLVPVTPDVLEGPVWTGKKVSRARAVEIWDLPAYRDAELCIEYANVPRVRYAPARAVWILGTDPLVVGLAPGEPRRTWQQYAALATGERATAGALGAPQAFMTRYVLDAELDQPIDRLVVFPADFWPGHEAKNAFHVGLKLVELHKPLSVDEALDALAAGDLLQAAGGRAGLLGRMP